MQRVGIAEDVMRRLPIGMLVGGAEPRHPERRRVGQRRAEVGRRAPRPARRP